MRGWEVMVGMIEWRSKGYRKREERVVGGEDRKGKV